VCFEIGNKHWTLEREGWWGILWWKEGPRRGAAVTVSYVRCNASVVINKRRESGTALAGMECGFWKRQRKGAWFDVRRCGGKRGMLAPKEGEGEDPRRYCGPKEWMGHARRVFENWNRFEKGQHSVFWQSVKGKVGSVMGDAILHNSWAPLSFFPESRFFCRWFSQLPRSSATFDR